MEKLFKTTALLTVCMIMLFGFNACQKDVASENTDGMQRVSVYLSDDPSFNFTKVLVDIRYVEVKIDTSNGNHHDHDWDDEDDHHGNDAFGHWDTLGITQGIYDLLRLRNGVDTLLATGLIPQGHITKIRFTLGDSNVVWTDSTHSEPLSICDHRPYVYAGLLTNGIDTLPGGQSIIRIDFNIERSIRRRNGHYCLQPVLMPFCRSRTGEIEGKVLPTGIATLITVYNATDTAYAIPWWHGEFKVRGLNSGIYSVLYDPLSPYQDTLITNIEVHQGSEIHLPDITLHQ